MSRIFNFFILSENKDNGMNNNDARIEKINSVFIIQQLNNNNKK